ncbi:MAG: hypothetical protein AB7O50_06405 [Pseudolabrys sp.]
MTLKWTFAIPVLAASALLVATAVVPSGPAEAANEAKCRKLAKKNAPGQNAQDRKRRGFLYQSCMQKGGKL